jgi:3,4-dihydroxy-2-butanone 4-phosphate synthase
MNECIATISNMSTLTTKLTIHCLEFVIVVDDKNSYKEGDLVMVADQPS